MVASSLQVGSRLKTAFVNTEPSSCLSMTSALSFTVHIAWYTRYVQHDPVHTRALQAAGCNQN